MTGLLAFGPYKVKTKILFGPKQSLYLKKQKQKHKNPRTPSEVSHTHTSCSTYQQKKLKLPNSSVQCHSHSHSDPAEKSACQFLEADTNIYIVTACRR